MRYAEIYENPWVSPLHPNWWMARLLKIVLLPASMILWRMKVEGRENLPTDAGAMLCYNHTSYADAVIAWLAPGRPVRMIGKSELFEKSKLVSWIARSGYAFPVSRGTADRNAIRWAVGSLQRGDLVGVFPEGTRVRSQHEPIVVHGGPALMAQMAGVAMVPVGIEGADRIWPKGRRLPRFPRVVVRIGEPIPLERFAGLPKKGRNDVVMDAVMDEVYRLARDSAPTAEGKQWR